MKNETIHVVDDNRQISNFLSHKLLPALGFRATASFTGKSAIELLRQENFSLMLLDLQLPDMTGLEVLENLNREGHNLPTILMTAHGSDHIVAEAFRLGVHDYLSKPLDEDRLNYAIQRTLREARLQQEKRQLTMLLKEQLTSQQVLAKVGQSVSSTLEIDEVLRRIVEAAVHLTKAEEGFIALLDNTTEKLYLRAVKNIDQERSKTILLPVQDSLIGDVLKTGKPVRITQSTTDNRIKISTGYLVNSILHVPLVTKGKPIGVLTVVNRAYLSPFQEKDETLLDSLADYAAVAIENANLYNKSLTEISERRRVEEALRLSEERYALAVRGANDGLWDWDLITDTVYYSPRWKAILGFAEDNISDTKIEWFGRVHNEDLERLRLDLAAHFDRTTQHLENEHRLLHKDGTYRWILCRGLAVWDDVGVATRIAGSITDVTDRKYAEEKLLHDAFYDTLTGLPNRALFMDHLNLSVERAKRRDDYSFAVLFLDLDRFKDVNDRFGHLSGDQLLVAVAKIFERRMRSNDTVARFGGDEFVILLEDVADEAGALQIAEWIHTELTMPFHISGQNVFVTASIGIVLSKTGYTRADDILRDADIAMYKAKANGKAQNEIFDPEMRVSIMNRLEMETDLRQAVEKDQLVANYQPIVSLSSGEIIGIEALLRWRHPVRGIISPIDFIPLAEDTGLIVALDRWILREACSELKKWQAMIPNFSDLSISVNVSGKNMVQTDLVDYVENTLKSIGLQGRNLILEITETNLLENSEAMQTVFQRLKNLGVQVQIDDFGIGYSSLSYLSNFPINALKIDRSFVNKIIDDENNLKIVQAIIMLSQRLGVGVIAEGVESSQQLAQLKDLGCEFGQGYLVSKPVDSDMVLNYLIDHFKNKQIPIGSKSP